MRVLHIGLSATGYPLNGLQKALMRLGEYDEINTATPNINEAIKKKSDSFKPDLVWIQVQRRDIVSIDAGEYLRKNGAFVMNWTGDVRTPQPSFYEDLGRHIDLTLFSNVTDVEILNSRGVKSDYLQIGYDPEIYTPIGDKIQSQEIVFLGNNLVDKFPLSVFRGELVAFLKSHYAHRFGVYGSGWFNGQGSYMGNQMGEARLYRSSKIAVNCSHFDFKRYSSDRLFRILGSGVFCLSKWYPDIELDFTDGEHLVIWKDLNDLKQKIDYYLNNPVERERISKNGNRIALEKFTFDCMAQNIEKLYIKHKNG